MLFLERPLGMARLEVRIEMNSCSHGVSDPPNEGFGYLHELPSGA